MTLRGARRHFARIEEVSIEPFVKELKANWELWGANTNRQMRIRVQRETQSIFLRGAVTAPHSAVFINDVQESRETAAAARFPKLMAWATDFGTRQRSELCRVLLAKLRPLGHVYEHVDKGSYYETRNRFHLVLISPGGSVMECGGESVVMREQELWWFDNKQPHKAHNPSNAGRTHLIFDLLPFP